MAKKQRDSEKEVFCQTPARELDQYLPDLWAHDDAADLRPTESGAN